MKPFSGCETEDAKVTPVESEYRLDSFAAGEVEKRGVGELESQAFVRAENRRHGRKVLLLEREQVESVILNGVEQAVERSWVRS